jgi:hypothetical protein
MTKQINLGSKTVSVTQLVVAIILAVFALGGGTFGLLKAEDRWNQRPDCSENALKAVQLEKNMLAGFKQMYYQQNVLFTENRLQLLYDELGKAKMDAGREPNNPAHRERIRYLVREIEKVKAKLQKLHLERVE